MKFKTTIICSFIAILPFISSCSNLAEKRLNKLQPSVKCNLIFTDEFNRFYVKKESDVYDISSKYDEYFGRGTTNISKAYYSVDNNFYNLVINNDDNNFSYLISSFDIESFSINHIVSFDHRLLVDRFPILENYKTFGINVSNGYHFEDTFDFILSFFDGVESRIITEVELIYDQTTLNQKYFGERFPNTYDPDQSVLEQTGVIIKKDERGDTYLQVQNNQIHFDSNYLNDKCENYKYIKGDIYPEIDSFPKKILRIEKDFFLEIYSYQNDLPMIKNNNHKTLIFLFDIMSNSFKYCGFLPNYSYLEEALFI